MKFIAIEEDFYGVLVLIEGIMKKALKYIALILAAAILAVSCEKEEPSFDRSLLIGKWVTGTLFYKYLDDGTGGTWDTSDDVREEEAQEYTWTLVNAELRQNHIGELGFIVPKVYTVTELSATTLKYRDEFSDEWTFTKVTE
jgi:hypothetical protein